MNKYLMLIIFQCALLIGGNAQTLSKETVVMETNLGVFKLKLYNETPLHKANFIKLIQNKTQIFLEMGSHDYIVPSVDQLKLFDTASIAGIKIEGRVNYLLGHHFDNDARREKLNFVLENLITNSETNFIQPQRLNYYIASPEGTFSTTDNNKRLASIELPRIISNEVDTVSIGYGTPQQKLDRKSTRLNSSHQI